MNAKPVKSETRPVSDFDQVAIRGNTCSMQLFITQGDQEGLTIEASPEYLNRLHSEVANRKLTVRLRGSWLEELQDALDSCINKPHLRLFLTVRELTHLEVQCAYRVQLSRIETPHLKLKLSGTGDFELDWLSSQTLEVHHSGAGVVRISGQVEEQNIILNGVGSYLAPDLDSQQASVRMSGVGRARIHANQRLNATLRGIGNLEYSGDAAVSKRVSGPGQVLHIARVREEAF